MMEHIRKNMILSTKLAILASICIIYLPDLPWRTIAMCIALRVRSHHPSMAAPVSEPSPMVSKVALSKASEKDFNHQKWGFPSQKSKFKMISKGLKNKHMAISRHGDFYRHIIRFDRQINRIPPNTLNKKICWVSLRHIYVYIYLYNRKNGDWNNQTSGKLESDPWYPSEVSIHSWELCLFLWHIRCNRQ